MTEQPKASTQKGLAELYLQILEGLAEEQNKKKLATKIREAKKHLKDE
jgi:hypothetical protein